MYNYVNSLINSTCRLFCYSCTCPTITCCDKSNQSPPDQQQQGTTPQANQRIPRPVPLIRTGTRYPGINENNRNPFLNVSPINRGGNQRRNNNLGGNRRSGFSIACCGARNANDDGVPCCCCFCP